MRRRDFLAFSAAGLVSPFTARAAEKDAPGPGAMRRRLAEHRLEKIEVFHISESFGRFVGRNARHGPTGRGSSYQVRRLTTDRGATGWAMSYGPGEKLQKYIGSRLSDLIDPVDGTRRELHPLQMALYDLAGSVLDMPVYGMLGGQGTREPLVYSGAIYFEDLEDRHEKSGVDAVLAACRQDYEAGYRAFKLKMGRGHRWMDRAEGLKRDIDVTRAVREEFPDCRVLVDANDGWPVEDAVEFVEQTADCDMFWIEEPFRENREDLLTLHEAMERVGCEAYIADGEARSDQADEPWRYGGYTHEFIERLYSLADEDLVDVFLLDLGIVGFSNWRRIMPELQEAGVQAAPHTWAWAPRTYYAAHLAAGAGNVLIVEGIPARSEQIDYGDWRIEGGRLHVPEIPGWGLKLNA